VTASRSIVDAQPRKEPNKTWEETWAMGHYMVVIGVDDRSVYLEDPDLIRMRPVMDRDEFVQAWHNYEGKIAFGSRCLHQGRGTRRAPVLYNPGCDADVCAGGPKDLMMVVGAGQRVLRRHPGRI
jgi:predicted double-glycine peptidase